MYNFLDPQLLPKVTTKCCTMDTYDAANLISSNFLVKSRGFIAYSTVKPPVDIDFQLLCNIKLSYIVIASEIGSHKCSNIEILVKAGNMEFVPICKAFYGESGVVFCNSKYYSKTKQPITKNTDYHLAYFRTYQCLDVNNVRIRILRTNGTVPCLANVEIWGNVSEVCSYETKEIVQRLTNKCRESILTSKVENNYQTNCESFDIPEEFKDALTYEVMAVPMTLPSGHTVDQSTLEKCAATDASCGRHSCDPFTGLKYTTNRKPLLNVGLKTRINMFLIENSHKPETYKLKRILGKDSCYQVPQMNVNVSYNYSDIVQTSKKIKLDCNTNNFNLEDAVNQALNNKDFMRFTNEIKNPENICVLCTKIEKNIYILPCKHLYCKSCTLKIPNSFKCKVCNSDFLKNTFERYHC